MREKELAEIVNLRQARKQKARTEKKARAAERRAAFGRDKPQKVREKSEAEQARKHLDGHKRERDE